jgi:mannosyl-3-phosphoglycerate phosphatase
VLESVKKETGIRIKGFSDLTAKELKSLCGLSLEEAKFAKEREYDEPFIVEGEQREIEIVRRKIQEKGLSYVGGGRFHHILGKNDKGKAVEILKELFENQFFSILTVGIGDSLNDVPMLLAVDEPILLKEEDDLLPEGLSSTPNLTVIEGRGPKVWNEAVLNILKKVKT